MTDIETVRRMAINWGEARPFKPEICPPEARVVTGKPGLDALFHYFESESGITLKLSDDHHVILGYDVIDEKKLAWFILRWS